MAGRSLNTDEAALWARVMAGVRPLRGVTVPATVTPPAAPARPTQVAAPVARPLPPRGIARPSPAVRAPGTTLDGSWDRQIARGAVIPDQTVDLHGHTLHSAHALLDAGLASAIARGDRVLLLVTGKPPRPESERPHARGAIRAAVADWLAASRHADAIAAVRGAHPRHGGPGALYIVLRRSRSITPA